MSGPWDDLTEVQRMQIREAQGEATRRRHEEQAAANRAAISDVCWCETPLWPVRGSCPACRRKRSTPEPDDITCGQADETGED